MANVKLNPNAPDCRTALGHLISMIPDEGTEEQAAQLIADQLLAVVIVASCANLTLESVHAMVDAGWANAERAADALGKGVE